MTQQEAIQQLVEKTKNQFSSNLFAMLQYGDSIRNDESDEVQILFCFNTIVMEDLKQLSYIIASLEHYINISPFILTHDEIRDSGDVFPVKFIEISRDHHCLFGTDPFKEFEISKEHIRIRVEQELRNILLRSRYAIVLEDGFTSRIEPLIKHTIDHLITNIDLLLELKVNVKSQQTGEVLNNCQQHLSIDTQSIQFFLDWKNDQIKWDKPTFRNHLEGYLSALDQLIHVTDNL